MNVHQVLTIKQLLSFGVLGLILAFQMIPSGPLDLHNHVVYWSSFLCFQALRSKLWGSDDHAIH